MMAHFLVLQQVTLQIHNSSSMKRIINAFHVSTECVDSYHLIFRPIMSCLCLLHHNACWLAAEMVHLYGKHLTPLDI